MGHKGLVPIVVLLLVTATIAAAIPQPMALPVSASGTSTVVLQEGLGGYVGTTDVYIDYRYPDTNAEQGPWLPPDWPRPDQLLVSADTWRSALIRFELAGKVPQGATIRSATLELYTDERDNTLTARMGVYRVLRPWVEREATWNRAAVGQPWGMPGCNDPDTDRNPVAADSAEVGALNQWYRFNVTSLVQAWADTRASNYGLLVRGEYEGHPALYRFVSSEAGRSPLRPILRVEYEPVPTITPTPTSVPGSAKLSFSPASKTVSQGSGNFTIDARLDNVTNLGGFQFSFSFDPGVAHAESVVLGSLVTGAGRAFTALAPQIDNSAGSVTFGAFSYGSEPGRSGSGPLATITFSPLAVGTSALHFGSVQLTAPNSTSIAASTQDGSIVVRTPLVGDLDGDCDVDIVDIMLVASRWGARSGGANYDARYDLDGDGDIDIVDIMLVAGHWGERCS